MPYYQSLWLTLVDAIRSNPLVVYPDPRGASGESFLLAVVSLLTTVWIHSLARLSRDLVEISGQDSPEEPQSGLVDSDWSHPLVGGLAYFVLVGWLTERFSYQVIGSSMSIRLVGQGCYIFYHGFSRFSFGKTGEAGEVILEIWFGSGRRLYPIDRSAHFYHNSSDQRPDHRHQSAGPSREYLYSDVKSVWTGFGTKLVTVNRSERQGNLAIKFNWMGKDCVYATGC